MQDNRSNGVQIARNVAIHNKIAHKHNAIHGEISNDVEQARLHDTLAAVRTGAKPVAALDFGCGSDNLSRHLLDLGAQVTAADVSRGFLDLVRERFPGDRPTTLWIKNGDASGVADASFDLIATYSLLHHIPNYLGAVGDLSRMCKPSGVIMIDHEASEGSWTAEPVFGVFRRAALKTDWDKYLTTMNYIHRVRRLFNPRYSNEGDIHDWHNDDIDRADVFTLYRDRCSDTRMMIFRKCAA